MQATLGGYKCTVLILLLVLYQVAMLLLERRRLLKLAAMVLGAWHAATGTMGKADSRLWRRQP